MGDLHDLAQADAGTLRLHPEPIALDDVVDQVVGAQQNREILLRAETTPVHIAADPVRLRQPRRERRALHPAGWRGVGGELPRRGFRITLPA